MTLGSVRRNPLAFAVTFSILHYTINIEISVNEKGLALMECFICKTPLSQIGK